MAEPSVELRCLFHHCVSMVSLNFLKFIKTSKLYWQRKGEIETFFFKQNGAHFSPVSLALLHQSLIS